MTASKPLIIDGENIQKCEHSPIHPMANGDHVSAFAPLQAFVHKYYYAALIILQILLKSDSNKLKSFATFFIMENWRIAKIIYSTR